jgi:pimeloyl-ACP methyl ester carboxylesterase
MPYINFQNKKIFYYAEGGGKCVVLIHGFGEDHYVWKYQIEKFKNNFFVIAPDLPGSGKSEILETFSTIEDYAKAIKAIIDVEILKNDKRKSITLIGHSMGGYVTLAFAEKYPELLNAFGLFHSSAYADDELKKETRRKGIDFIKKNGPATFLKTSVPNLFSDKTKKENPELVEDLIDLSKDFSSEALIQYYQAMIRRPERTGILKSFVNPVLFLSGKNDSAVPIDLSLKQCYLPSVSHFHIMQNSGHMGMWEEREKTNDILNRFLDSN